MKPADYIREGEAIRPLGQGKAGRAFDAFYREHRRAIGETIAAAREADARVRDVPLRAGMVLPLHAALSPRVKEFCALPYRHADGTFAACEGVRESWKACPPHSPPVEETTALLRESRSFLVLQFGALRLAREQKFTHLFVVKAAESLGERGYSVSGVYGSGPCRICRSGCDPEGDCRLPERRIFALESCGFWVNRLCRQASKYPILGDGDWEIRWITDWGLPTQTPMTFKPAVGILLA